MPNKTFSSEFLPLSVFKSNLRNLMIFKNLQRGIVALNKGHPQDLSHILFLGNVLPPIAPRATISPISLSSSSNVTVQLLFPMTRCASEVVHFRIFFSVGSLKKMRNEKRGMPRMMLDVKYAVGPARILAILCCCSRPVETWRELSAASGIFLCSKGFVHRYHCCFEHAHCHKLCSGFPKDQLS